MAVLAACPSASSHPEEAPRSLLPRSWAPPIGAVPLVSFGLDSPSSTVRADLRWLAERLGAFPFPAFRSPRVTRRHA
jgi:hypothetical protein